MTKKKCDDQIVPFCPSVVWGKNNPFFAIIQFLGKVEVFLFYMANTENLFLFPKRVGFIPKCKESSHEAHVVYTRLPPTRMIGSHLIRAEYGAVSLV